MRILVLCILLIFVGCEELVEVESVLHKPRIVISSYPITHKNPSVYVTLTQPAYSASIRKIDDFNARITNVTSGYAYTLTPNYNFDCITFTTHELEYESGGIYMVDVSNSNGGVEAFATDTIPYPAQIVDASVQPVSNNSFNQVSISVKYINEKPQSQYFEVALYLAEVWGNSNDLEFHNSTAPLKSNHPLITRETYYPDLMLIGSGYPETLLFRFDENQHESIVDFMYETSSSWNPLTGYQFPEHYLRVELRAVSNAYFYHKTSKYAQMYAVEGDFLYGIAPPVAVISNIVGGYGIFAGYAKVDTVMHLTARTID